MGLLHMYPPHMKGLFLTETSGSLWYFGENGMWRVDKGFQIQDLLAPLGVRLNIHHF